MTIKRTLTGVVAGGALSALLVTPAAGAPSVPDAPTDASSVAGVAVSGDRRLGAGQLDRHQRHAPRRHGSARSGQDHTLCGCRQHRRDRHGRPGDGPYRSRSERTIVRDTT